MRGQFATIIVNIILFISAAILTYLFVSSSYNSLNNINNAAISRQELISNKLNTIIQIDSCAYDNSSRNLILYVKNYGNTLLNQSNTVLFVNGYLKENITINLVQCPNEINIWAPNCIISINTSWNSNGYYYIKVVSEYGVDDQKLIFVNVSSSICLVQ